MKSGLVIKVFLEIIFIGVIFLVKFGDRLWFVILFII